MLIKDIDIQKIEKLLNSVPKGLECEAICFVGKKYQLKLIAGSDEVNEYERMVSVKQLQDILKNFV